MRVQMKQRIGGNRNGEAWPDVGETIDLPDHEAADMIAAGYCQEPNDEDVPDQSGDETASGSDDSSTGGSADGTAAGSEPASTEAVKPKAKKAAKKSTKKAAKKSTAKKG